MAYYATVQRNVGGETQVCFAAGPYNQHGPALAAADVVARVFREVDDTASWLAYGTTRVGTNRDRVGALNDRVGYDGPGRLP